MRMKGIDVLKKTRNRKVRKGGPRGLYGWRRNSKAPSEEPPQYNGETTPYGFPEDEKMDLDRKQADDNFAPSISPAMLPPLSIPNTTATLNRTESPNSSFPLARNVSPFGAYSPHDSPISDLQASYNNTGRRNTILSRQVPEANNTIPSQAAQSAYATRESPNTQYGNQPQPHRMSYMSSLSSGFGDGLVIPDPNNPNVMMQGYRPSRPPGAFSWMQVSAQRRGDRDTIYTSTSEDSAPRFRTVNSWVAQQATRVPVSEQDIPSVPAIPLQLQTAQYYTPPIQPVHQRNISEDPVFKFHPGEEVQISRGSRVPSEILNRKTGIN
jgi:hypothetical protein